MNSAKEVRMTKSEAQTEASIRIWRTVAVCFLVSALFGIPGYFIGGEHLVCIITGSGFVATAIGYLFLRGKVARFFRMVLND